MSDWHGYPQPEDRHPERPWWRRGAHGAWTRTGGHTVGTKHPTQRGFYRPPAEVLADIDDVDRRDPIPAPPILCGQVWLDLRSRVAFQVTGVGPSMIVLGGRVYAEPEPLTLYLLVAGPGAPWAPLPFRVDNDTRA